MCQIDVDKLDYIRRDCYHLGIKMSCRFSRLITSARVITTPEGYEVLGWPKKLEFNIFNLFAARYRLHKQVYNHHAIKAHEFIIVRILTKIKNSLKSKTWKLTDASIMCGLHHQFSDLYEKLQTRQIAKLVGEIVVKLPHKYYRPEDPNPRTILDHIIQVTKIGFAGGNENPLNQVYYYTKDEQNIGLRISPQNNSFCVPAQHQELIVRMYSKAGSVSKQHKKSWTEIKQNWLGKSTN